MLIISLCLSSVWISFSLVILKMTYQHKLLIPFRVVPFCHVVSLSLSLFLSLSLSLSRHSKRISSSSSLISQQQQLNISDRMGVWSYMCVTIFRQTGDNLSQFLVHNWFLSSLSRTLSYYESVPMPRGNWVLDSVLACCTGGPGSIPAIGKSKKLFRRVFSLAIRW